MTSMARITMPGGKPGEGTVFFVYRAKLATGNRSRAGVAGQKNALTLFAKANTIQSWIRDWRESSLRSRS